MINKVEISISPSTVKNILLVAIAGFLVWKLSDILVLMITAIMVASAVDPAVKWLRSKKLPLTLSAAMVVVCLVLPLAYVLITVIPDFVSQFPEILARLTAALGSTNFLPPFLRQLDFSQYFQNGSSYLWESTKTISNILVQAVTFIFLVFYLLIDGEALRRLISLSIPKRNRQRVEKIAAELSAISGHYIRGNLLISVICATVTFAGLLFLHIPYALPLAIFAGVFDLLPLVGATIGSIPPIILGFTISPLTGILTIALFVVYQEIENYILAPNIYNKVLSLLPFFSFISVIVGAVIFGVAGAFLALPIAAGIPTIIKYVEAGRQKTAKA